MNITVRVAKGCGQLSSNYTFFADIWFSRNKISEEANSEGVNYFGPVKTSHNGFCLDKF